MVKSVLIIAGMHRSGTSLVAQWLHRCGLHIGDDFLGPSVGNAEGHFEDRDFVRLHEEILTSKSLPHSGLTDHLLPLLSIEEENKIKEVIESKNGVENQWGWKDPRTCLFLPVYRRLLPQAYCLVILRDYTSSVSSLIHRTFMHAERKYTARSRFAAWLWKWVRKKRWQKYLYKKFSEPYLKVWIRYNEELINYLKLTAESNHLVVHYEDLNKNDLELFAHFTNNWQLNLHYTPFSQIFKKGLLNKPVAIEPYIRNKHLLLKADALMNELELFRQKQVWMRSAV